MRVSNACLGRDKSGDVIGGRCTGCGRDYGWVYELGNWLVRRGRGWIFQLCKTVAHSQIDPID